jgi:ubiquinone/menaquinone biosynthesis C-methylase UbiE
MLNLGAVDLGFSRKAEVYDAYCESHPVIRWARDIVRREVVQHINTGESILELNAGTGADAAYFVQQGCRVHATDIAEGMVSAIQNKIKISNAQERFTAQKVSFTELEKVKGAPYDLVFSNFGGLNCIPDLQAVTKFLDQLIKPYGYVVWVIMPPVCPWELAQVMRGKFRVAARRLNPQGVLANVEGAQVMTWYHSSNKIIQAFSPKFHLIKKQSLSLFCPPSYMDRFPHRFPRLTNFLLKLDGQLGRRFPFNNFGDFIAYTFRHGN